MPVFRWGHSWSPFRDLEREVDQLLAKVSLFHGIRLGQQYPPVNVYELDHEFMLTAELPGTKAEDLEVLVSGGTLTIKGRRSGPEGIPDDRYRRQERPRGNWQARAMVCGVGDGVCACVWGRRAGGRDRSPGV